MKQKILFLFSALLLISISVTAQTESGSITGVVISDATAEPLPGATIFIEELQKGAVADEQGAFAFSDIPAASYTLTVKFIGFHSQSLKVNTAREKMKKLVVRLKAESQSLKEVVIMGKSEARKIREQAMPVSVISMKQLQGTVSDVQGILAKTVGVAIRSSGGVGSSSRLSVRGLEGKRIGFFIDETSLNDQSDFISLNDIPVDMIDRIEIYKGIVPAKFGGSSMGGAVNIVLKEYPDRYADVSYTHESFNVNKAQAVFKRNLKESGLVFGIGGGYTSADNDYTMESPYIKGLKIKREHDYFRNFFCGGSIKAKKWWFDKVELEPAYADTYKDIQGIETDIREAHTRSRFYMLNKKLEKENFLIEGLDLDMSTAVAYTQYQLVDTAKLWYDWSGNAYPSPLLSAESWELVTLQNQKIKS